MMRSTLARALTTTALLVLSLAGAPPAAAQLPDPVQSLDWCSGAKDCLAWTEVDGATAYHLYRGHAGSLSGLVDETADSCAFGSFVTATTGGGVGDPAAGNLDWYLVTAANLFGEGSPGEGTSGPRVLDSSGPCGAAPGLVLNEVDYDQPGTDSAEFVEIFNAGTADRELSGLVLIFVNGLTSSEYARVELGEAGATLPAGDYLVAGAPGVVSALPPGTLHVTLASSTNNERVFVFTAATVDIQTWR